VFETVTLFQGEFILQSIIVEAGWPIWPLLFISVVALAIIFERLMALRLSRVCPVEVATEASRLLRGKGVTEESLDKLAQSSLSGKVLSTILANKQQPINEIRLRAEETGADVAHEMQRFLPALSMIATIAPLMGLFGTVVGMIEIFAAYQPGGTDPGQLARGISIALYNTGFGILIAVPAAIAHRLLRVHVNNLLVKIEQSARSLIQQIYP
jgi:biopolymer transport protein ExbB